jgi:hypothetical protein
MIVACFPGINAVIVKAEPACGCTNCKDGPCGDSANVAYSYAYIYGFMSVWWD